MSRFRGTVSGDSSTEASRLANEFLVTDTNGWDTGVRVTARINDTGRDCFDIYSTGGSHKAKNQVYLGTVTEWGFERAD